MSLPLINAIIIDDEPMARALLETHCQKIGYITVIASCKSATAAFEVLHREQVNLLFLDIKMPGINGLNFLKSLKNPPKVIFTTAFHEHAVEAFELEAVDYLLKPITYERFLKAVQRVSGTATAQNTTPQVAHKTQSSIFLKINRRLIQVELNDILYLESLGDYVKVFTTKEVLVCFNTLSKLINILPENQFQRVHRSYMISLKKISFMEGNFVRIANQDVPIGQTYKDALMKKLNLIND